jgi:tRNA/tmRNA/rRNA uracil-C5-methylase (TrmA/RlmC/RlmD family)
MIDISPEIYKWIEEHQDEDASKLRLRYHKQMTDELDFAILQIECRRKASKKLPETLQNKHFIFPTTLSAEQCTSDLLSSFHATLIEDGVSMVDLTCGLGIDVYHFAQGAKSITAVERNLDIAQAVMYNAGILGFSNINVQNTDCCEFIRNTEHHFDVAFIDPARRGNSGKRLFALSDCEPNVTAILDDIKEKCDKLIIKASPMLDISQVIRDLPGVTEIYAIGTPQECKEIVAIVDFKSSVE